MKKIIKLEVKEDKIEGGGILFVYKKIDDKGYEALAVANVNQKCYDKLKALEGEYKCVE